MFEDNTIRLELPLKYPETIHITFIPDFPGPLVCFFLLVIEKLASHVTRQLK
jgi:hypothetical protein